MLYSLLTGEYHMTRKMYYIFGWDYDIIPDQRQRHLHFLLCEQIKKTNVRFMLNKYKGIGTLIFKKKNQIFQ